MHFVIYRPKRGKFKHFEFDAEGGLSLKEQLKRFVNTAVFDGAQLPNRLIGDIVAVKPSRTEL